jgi:colanic acid biosynthesis glycosyl transferase WcaI
MPGASPQLRRVIFLNRYYWPEEPATAQLLTDLAGALASAGHAVTVITSRPAWSALPLRQSDRGVAIVRVTGTRWGQLGLPGRVVDYVTFYLMALLELCLVARRGDQVVALTDPPLVGVGVWVVARLLGARVFHWVQDIYPEIAVVLTGQRWLRAVMPLRNLAWRRSDGCVTLGADMADTLAQAGVAPARITVSPNWAPAGLIPQPRTAADPLRTAWQLAGKFVVAYSGNLGRVHDLAPVLDVAAALRAETGIAFVFIGAGAQRAELEAAAVKRGLANVHFRPPQPRSGLAASLALGDVHLVTLAPGCERLVFPSKLYGAAAIGRPVVFLGPRECEIARLVAQAGFGLAFAPGETAAIAASIRQLCADPGRLRQLGAAAEAFNRAAAGPARALADWEKLLEPVR